MGVKPIPTRTFKKFLKYVGCEYIRTEGGHEIWDKKDDSLLRPITLQTKNKDVPILHIHTSLENLGITKKEFGDILKKLK
jgi:hypothetical protein